MNNDIYCANLYPMNAPSAVGTGNTMNLPKDVTYFGRLITLPTKK